MLPFPLTLLSVSNSNHLRAFLAPCELDVRRKSFRSLWRTPARQARLAFLPEPLAMTGAPDSATSIRRYREALANETRLHSAPYPPGIVRAFPHDANCRAASRTARALSFQNLADHPLRNHPRGAIADGRHFNFVSFRNQRHNRIAIQLFDFFCLRNRRTQPNSEVASEMIAADRDHRGVRNRTFQKHNQAGRARAHVG